jgi:hypothetical protein
MADAGRGSPPNQNGDKNQKKPRHLTHAEMMMLLAPPASMTAEESLSFDQLSKQLSAQQYEQQLLLDDAVPPAAPPPPIGPLTAADVADMRQPVTDPALYPIAKIVCVSVTHGSSVGPTDCREVAMAEHDFKRVFFFGEPEEDICFDDPRFAELFTSRKRPFKPTPDTIGLLFGTNRPKCRYEFPYVYLPPIVFTLEPQSDNWTFREHNLSLRRLMGLYLYIVRRNPADSAAIFIQKLKVANYHELDQEMFLTYSIIFDKFRQYIKLNPELHRFVQGGPDRSPDFSPLTVGFFCCRGAHLRQLYPQFPMALITPQIPLPLPKIYHHCSLLHPFLVAPNAFARLFLHILPPDYTLEYLKKEHVQPLFTRGPRNMWWQSCLYNLLFFFKIISRETADALASVATQQQIKQLTTGVRLVSGESTEQAIRILNGLIPSNVHREFIIQRSPIPLGISKIMSVLYTLVVPNTYVVFAKVYVSEVVPTAPNTPSQIGHWVAIARFGDTGRICFVCVQTNQYIDIPPLDSSNTETVVFNRMIQLFASYVVMDLLYIITPDSPYFAGPDVLHLQLPAPAHSSDSESDGGMRRHRHVVSKKRNFKSKTKSNSNSKFKSKTRTKKIV